MKICIQKTVLVVSVNMTIFNVQCISVYCTIDRMYYKLQSTLYIMYIVQCTVYTIHCTLYTVDLLCNMNIWSFLEFNIQKFVIIDDILLRTKFVVCCSLYVVTLYVIQCTWYIVSRIMYVVHTDSTMQMIDTLRWLLMGVIE